MDYDNDVYEDCEDMDTLEEQDMIEPIEQTGTDENADEGISLEDYIFWGGYLGINLDEEEEIKKNKKGETE